MQAENYIAEVQQAFATILAEGSLVISDSEHLAAHFGNFFIEFAGPALRVSVVRDRMEFLVKFAPAGSDEWIDDETIWHLIGADDVAAELERQGPRTIEPVARASAAHFSAIRELFIPANVAATLRRANEYEQARAARRYGYSPATPVDGA